MCGVLKAMFLREPIGKLRLAAAERAVGHRRSCWARLVAVVFGLFPIC